MVFFFFCFLDTKTIKFTSRFKCTNFEYKRFLIFNFNVLQSDFLTQTITKKKKRIFERENVFR